MARCGACGREMENEERMRLESSEKGKGMENGKQKGEISKKRKRDGMNGKEARKKTKVQNSQREVD